MNLLTAQELVTTIVTSLSAIIAVFQYVWNSRPHYQVLKSINNYSIGEPKDSLSIQIANTGKLKMNIALKGITNSKHDGSNQHFADAISFPKSMTDFKSFDPNEVGTLIEFSSKGFYQLITYRSNSKFLSQVQSRIKQQAPIEFYVWTIDYRQQKRPLYVKIGVDTGFYRNLTALLNH
ncbi:hypothetical protein [Nicoliella lavandulae]|uniref:Uncharacterized protein n=1 Tax=Nicoliella lavandulae TaxID=3082954 RepID=A0ABU8SMM5_9LACO